MKFSWTKPFILFGGMFFVFLPLFAFGIPAVPEPVGPRSVTETVDIIKNLVSWFEVVVWALALAMLLFTALQFLTAAGSEEKITTARKSLLWGLVGVAVALFARGSAVFVSSVLQGQ